MNIVIVLILLLGFLLVNKNGILNICRFLINDVIKVYSMIGFNNGNVIFWKIWVLFVLLIIVDLKSDWLIFNIFEISMIVVCLYYI